MENMSRIISYDYGHNEGNYDGSANGFLYEYKVNREYGKVAVENLKRCGFTMVDCTPPDHKGLTLGQSLVYRVNKANESNTDLHLCFHANCFDNSNANGAEVEVASDNSARIGSLILMK
jgi:N-acetylmuramoyl-L-alanine amidase